MFMRTSKTLPLGGAAGFLIDTASVYSLPLKTQMKKNTTKQNLNKDWFEGVRAFLLVQVCLYQPYL